MKFISSFLSQGFFFTAVLAGLDMFSPLITVEWFTTCCFSFSVLFFSHFESTTSEASAGSLNQNNLPWFQMLTLTALLIEVVVNLIWFVAFYSPSVERFFILCCVSAAVNVSNSSTCWNSFKSFVRSRLYGHLFTKAFYNPAEKRAAIVTFKWENQWSLKVDSFIRVITKISRSES